MVRDILFSTICTPGIRITKLHKIELERRKMNNVQKKEKNVINLFVYLSNNAPDCIMGKGEDYNFY